MSIEEKEIEEIKKEIETSKDPVFIFSPDNSECSVYYQGKHLLNIQNHQAHYMSDWINSEKLKDAVEKGSGPYMIKEEDGSVGIAFYAEGGETIHRDSKDGPAIISSMKEHIAPDGREFAT